MSAALPPAYQPWLSAVCHAPLPDGEARATCEACVMARQPAGGPVPRFDAEIGCCTYVPVLANHTVGRILTTGTPEGRQSVTERIHRLEAVTPLGLDWPHAVSELYDDEHRAFGIDRRLRCPHHLTTPSGGRCAIWAHRNATCATWFCQHDRGESGRKVWMALRDLLTAIDRALAWFAIEALGISPERRELLTPRSGLLRGSLVVDGHPGGAPTEANRRRVWGRWFGREEAFFIEAAAVIDGTPPDVLHPILHNATRAPRNRLDEAIRALQQPPPRAPVRGRLTLTDQDDSTTLVQAYSQYDPLTLPSTLAHALDVFDGAPLELVRHRLSERGVPWDAVELTRLMDFRVLDRAR